MQLGRHPPIAVAGPLGADLLDTFHEPRLLDRLACRLVIVGRPREPHQPASFCDREATALQCDQATFLAWLSPAGTRDDLAASVWSALRCAPARPDAGQ